MSMQDMLLSLFGNSFENQLRALRRIFTVFNHIVVPNRGNLVKGAPAGEVSLGKAAVVVVYDKSCSNSF